jgi:uncharacterized protein (TIGR02270 family)
VVTSIRAFNVELYREHLDEASFLYDQRLAYLHDPEVNWPDLKDWEERFESHIDALVVGGELALDVCRQQVAAGAAGEMHAALRVFCRQDRKDDAFAVLGALDPTDEGAVRAAAEALCFGLPRAWQDDLLRMFQSDQQHLTHVLARVIGYRRAASEKDLKNKLAEKPLFGSAELAWALGRIGSAGAVPLLWPMLDSDDERVCEAAAIALMRLGDERLLQQVMLAARTHSWARRVLAIGGNSRSVRVLLDVLDGESADASAVIALGLLGDLAAVAPLLELLDHEDLAVHAAVALNAMTGAELYARVFVPDEIDLDELSDDEREAFEKDGTLPTRNGQPYGNWERRPLLDQAGWRAWLEANKYRFARQQRWRMGRQHGPGALVECLKSATSPYVVRAATYEELVVRFGLDIPFEVDLPVSQQRRYLGKIEDWAARQSGNFDEGRWYFAGQLQG